MGMFNKSIYDRLLSTRLDKKRIRKLKKFFLKNDNEIEKKLFNEEDQIMRIVNSFSDDISKAKAIVYILSSYSHITSSCLKKICEIINSFKEDKVKFQLISSISTQMDEIIFEVINSIQSDLVKTKIMLKTGIVSGFDYMDFLQFNDDYYMFFLLKYISITGPDLHAKKSEKSEIPERYQSYEKKLIKLDEWENVKEEIQNKINNQESEEEIAKYISRLACNEQKFYFLQYIKSKNNREMIIESMECIVSDELKEAVNQARQYIMNFFEKHLKNQSNQEALFEIIKICFQSTDIYLSPTLNLGGYTARYVEVVRNIAVCEDKVDLSDISNITSILIHEYGHALLRFYNTISNSYVGKEISDEEGGMEMFSSLVMQENEPNYCFKPSPSYKGCFNKEKDEYKKNREDYITKLIDYLLISNRRNRNTFHSQSEEICRGSFSI